MNKSLPLTFGITAAVLTLLGYVQAATAPASAPAQPVAQVKTIAVKQEAIAETIPAYGNVAFSTNELTMVSLPFSSQIVRLLVSAGQAVKKGTLLFEAMPDLTTQASLLQAQSAVELARGELRRTEAMAAQQLATQSQVATAKKALADANANLAALTGQGVALHSRPVEAPFDCVVVTVAANQGDRLAANATVLQIGKTGAAGAVHVLLGAEPADIGRLRIGARVTLGPVERRLTKSAPMGGQITAIKGAINPQTRLIDVTVTLDANAQSGLPPGTLMQAQIEVSRTPHWVVPRAAVLTDEKGDYLFQAVNGQAHRVVVQRRAEAQGLYGVDGPLQANYPVIASGNYILSDGMRIQEVK